MRTKKKEPVRYVHDILTDAQVKLICKEMERVGSAGADERPPTEHGVDCSLYGRLVPDQRAT